MFSFITDSIEPASYLIYFLTVLLYYSNGSITTKTLLILLYSFSAITMGYSSYLVQNGYANTFLYNFCLLPASTLLISGYFYSIITNSRLRKTTIAIFILNLLFFLYYLFSRKNNYFNSIGFAMLSLSIVIYAFLFFQQKIQNISEKPIYDFADFWLVGGYLISYSGSFLVFLTYYYLTQKYFTSPSENLQQQLTLLWGIPNILLFISSLFTLTGLIWIRWRKRY